MSRGGQVYFIHNRVDSIFMRAASIQELLPNCRIGVGHGQMGEAELEKALLGFMRHEYDVFVCTTIAENGLDIPLANTMIIENAERHGLSELYQLRGRVGRSNRRAYAYLLVPADTELSEIARKRLAALKEFSDLGAGFKIAALDLELRGAGNILGGEQHGHIGAVGFDMYVRLLEETVHELKGEEVPLEVHSTLNLGLDIRIPSEYIADEHQRLRAYKRIADATTTEASGRDAGGARRPLWSRARSGAHSSEVLGAEERGAKARHRSHRSPAGRAQRQVPQRSAHRSESAHEPGHAYRRRAVHAGRSSASAAGWGVRARRGARSARRPSGTIADITVLRSPISARWLALTIFVFSSVLNYLDRQVLATMVEIWRARPEFPFTYSDYGLLLCGFLDCLRGERAVRRLVYRSCRAESRRHDLGRGLGRRQLRNGHVAQRSALLVWRALLGVAEASGVTAVAKAVGMYLFPKELAVGQAVSQLGLSLGAGLAPGFAVFFAYRYDWRWAFFAAGILSLAWIPIWLFTARLIPPAVEPATEIHQTLLRLAARPETLGADARPTR